ncbi:MAG: nuclear transport factor 2 family protein [Gammaproteobacteria bacterium]|nr:nuclear transport factor 2 family protein [Gammaproteobacteria bacterium]
MTEKRKDRICALLKGIETGDEAAVAVVHPERYIQHNPQTREGGEGLAALFKRLAKSSPRVNVVRVFSDGDFVFAHTEYDFSTSRIGFEVFRFEGDLAVEHWDNIQSRKGPNPSGHSMVDGPTRVSDLGRTEENRELVRSFIEEILIGGRHENLEKFIDAGAYTEHNPRLRDGLPALCSALADPAANEGVVICYDRLHRLLAEGNFVLSVCEGELSGVHTSFYDLYRIRDGKVVEHWDTAEAIPPRSEWKNANGKF